MPEKNDKIEIHIICEGTGVNGVASLLEAFSRKALLGLGIPKEVMNPADSPVVLVRNDDDGYVEVEGEECPGCGFYPIIIDGVVDKSSSHAMACPHYRADKTK